MTTAELDRLTRDLRLTRLDDAIRVHGAVTGHPETLAALAAHPDWRAVFEGVRMVPSPWWPRDVIRTGQMADVVSAGGG